MSCTRTTPDAKDDLFNEVEETSRVAIQAIWKGWMVFLKRVDLAKFPHLKALQKTVQQWAVAMKPSDEIRGKRKRDTAADDNEPEPKSEKKEDDEAAQADQSVNVEDSASVMDVLSDGDKDADKDQVTL